jgi:methionyl-tRNA synthetase
METEHTQEQEQNTEPQDRQEPQYVDYDTFKVMDMRVGTIRFVEPIEGADKLLRFLIDFGEEMKTDTFTDEAGNTFPVRQIVSGIREYYPEYEMLVGMQALYILNLPPRTIRGVTSHGMLLAVGDERPIFMTPHDPVAPGSPIR